jgi:hypothetical protein
MSRLENAPSKIEIARLMAAMVDQFCDSPANAADCHHHIYDARPEAALRPPDALVEDYRALQRRISRNVIVTGASARRLSRKVMVWTAPAPARECR